MNSIRDLWRSGFVRRWHMNPDMADCGDTTAAHQGRCAMLVIALFPDHSRELLHAAVTHDAAEVVVGDLSAPFKRAGGRAAEVALAHAEVEAEVLERVGLAVDLDELDAARLTLVDRLDAYLMARHHRPQILARDDWREDRERLLDMATELGVFAQMVALFALARGVDA